MITTVFFIRLLQRSETPNPNGQTETENREAVTYRESVLLYVIGNIVSQGNILFLQLRIRKIV